jgi:hypothetical protein
MTYLEHLAKARLLLAVKPVSMRYMIRRLVVILSVLLFPSLVLADTSTPDQATQSLGPQAQNPATSSSADGTTLQPAGSGSSVSTLQQSVNTLSDPTVLGGSSAESLQSPADTQQQLQVISDSADGGPQSVGGSNISTQSLVLVSILIGAIVAFIGWLYGSHPKLFTWIPRFSSEDAD